MSEEATLIIVIVSGVIVIGSTAFSMGYQAGCSFTAKAAKRIYHGDDDVSNAK